LDLGGDVEGNVTTDGGVVVRSGARLRGEVKSAGVAIEPGAKVSVRLNTPFEIEF
jgi:cytoskeletal protein CcmA (bactofilin family)